MRRLAIIVVCVVTILVAAAVVAGGVGAQHLATRVAVPRVERRLGAKIRFAAIRPGLGRVTAEGIVVALPDIPEARVTVQSAVVEYDPLALLRGRLDVRRLELHGPRLELAPNPDRPPMVRLGRYLRRLAGRSALGGNEAGHRSRRLLSLRGGAVTVTDSRGFSLTLADIDGDLYGGIYEIRVAATRFAARLDGPDLVASGHATISGTFASAQGLTVDEASVDQPVVRLSLGERAEELRSAGRALRQALGDLRGPSEPQGRGAEGSARPEAGTTVRLRRGRIDLFRPGADRRALALAELEGQLFGGNGAEPPSIRLSGRAAPGGGAVAFSGTLEEGEPRVHVRLTAFRVGDLAADLSRRGVRFDQTSLVDADMRLQFSEGRVQFRGEVSTDRLTVGGRLLADRPIENLRVRCVARGDAPLSGDAVVIDEARLWLNGIEFGIAGQARRDEREYALDVTADLYPAGCAALLAATPEPLRENLAELDLEGMISGVARVSVDSRRLSDTVLDVRLNNTCRASGRGFLAVSRLDEVFTHRVELPDDEVYEFITGPSSFNWAPLPRISPYLIAAVLTTEDGRFFGHRGFSLTEIRGALVRDLAARGPRFGASTITMQLARNLYLGRRRTVARKLQEAVLTWYLEEQLTKDEILALYLNIIEFGPRIFGVRQAAMHYFGRTPDDLSPREAVFLAKLLPNPVGRHASTYERGELSERWNSMLDRVLRVMRDRGHLTSEELTAALAERIVFHREGDPLPERRYWREGGRAELRQRDDYDALEDQWDDDEEGWAEPAGEPEE